MIVSFVCIKQRQLKIERMLRILPRALSGALSGFAKYLHTEIEAEGLDNRYCVKCTQFGIGLFYRLTNWLMFLCGQIQSPRPDVMPDGFVAGRIKTSAC